MIASCLLGCGPVIEPDATSGAEDGTTDAVVSTTDVIDPVTADAATSDPTAVLPPSELDGEYLFAVALVISPDTPLQWLATVDHDQGDGRVAMVLQSLSLDQLSTTTPREPIGDPMVLELSLDENGRFGHEFGELYIPGEANPITGSDIRMTLVIEGTASGRALWCGEAFGMITQPLILDLLGSTFAMVPVDGGVLPGDPIVARCP